MTNHTPAQKEMSLVRVRRVLLTTKQQQILPNYFRLNNTNIQTHLLS